MYRKIHLIDTSVASDNIGDEIIVEACRAGLSEILRDAYVTTSSGHDGLGPMGRKLAEGADVIFLLGTNALSPRARRWRKTSVVREKGKVVCFTLTARKPDSINDRRLIEILSANYDRLLFWPQQARDLPYVQSLNVFEHVSQVVSPNLAAYDDVLRNPDVDVIGTRLHGTIRGLMHGRRSIVIAIDHRAKELGATSALPWL